MEPWTPNGWSSRDSRACTWWPTSGATPTPGPCSSSTEAARPGTPGDRRPSTVAAQGWRTVALDLRGHGDSDWAPNGDYSFTAFGADCVAVVDQLGRPPVLVGASLGGMSAMLAEGTSDRTVSCGLVLVDITPKSNPAGHPAHRRPSCSRAGRVRLAGGGGRRHRRLHPATGQTGEPGRPHEGAAPAATAAGTGTGTREFIGQDRTEVVPTAWSGSWTWP